MLKENNQKFVDFLGSLSAGIRLQIYGPAEELVRSLYGLSNHTNINKARAEKLSQMTGFRSKEKVYEMVLRKVKKVNCSLLPPCRNALKKTALS